MDNLDTFQPSSAIAIIGLSGRFPGSKNINEFWQNLCNGIESVSFFTDDELILGGLDSAILNNPNYVKASAFLDNIESFDASFFGFNPREAQIADPQHRLFLECAWEALENAGYDSKTYAGRIGVYAGVGLSTYSLLNLYSNLDFVESTSGFETLIRNDKDFLPTITSYKLNLRGPSINIQTACSTSLVAVHVACQSLLNGECDIAIAGGVKIKVPQKVGYLYQEGGISSPDGHCRAFDAKAQGTVGGNGVGIVVLKRLEEAIADGDHIDAIIKGSAINNDGSLRVGYTAPSVDGQAEVIAEALAMAGISPEMVSYVEAHGTGTVLGDPIEIAALTKAFRAYTHKKGFCPIGSVKTNIGHLDTAAGVVGLIKTVLALKHQLIPPSLHFEQPNPQIDFANSPFYVTNTLSEWKSKVTPRYAGVSSFGIGGTNAHVIVEEAPPVAASGSSRPWQLLILSAKTGSALEAVTVNLLDYLKQHPELNLADVAYTLQVGRCAFDHRRMVVCQNLDDATNALERLDPKRIFTSFQESKERPVVFMFPGQGAQYVNMGRELYQTEPVFRELVDRCCERLETHIGLDLRHVLYPSEEQTEAASKLLKQTSITQPALFVIEYALAHLWMTWGVRPQAMIGHSIGEYVTATLSGVFSLEEALALVSARGGLMQQMPPGAMLSVSLPEAEVHSLLSPELSLAASNAPSLCVVSGSVEAIAQLQNRLTEQGIKCRRLETSHAFHSRMMDPILEPFMEQVRKFNLKSPQIPFISNVTGTWITDAEATDPNYWAKHLQQPIHFARGITELLKQPEQILLEVGPGRTLSSFALKYPGNESVVLNSLRHPQEQQSDIEFLLNTLGQLWLHGASINWSSFYTQERRYRIPLPTYPFERQPYWIEPQVKADNFSHPQIQPSKSLDIADWFYIPSWKRSMLPAVLGEEKLQKQKFYRLIFVDSCGVGSQLVKRLKQEGQDVITVVEGEQFTQLSDCAYAINPKQQDDYETLLRVLKTQNKTPKTIFHLWSITANEQTQSGLEFLDKYQELGFYSLLFLAQALGQWKIEDTLQLLVVTNNLQDVTGSESLCPEKATLLGPCRVMPLELSNVTCCCIDVVIPESMAQRMSEKLLLTRLPADDPPKSLLKRGTLSDSVPPLNLGTLSGFSPLFKGGWGGSKGLKTHPRGDWTLLDTSQTSSQSQKKLIDQLVSELTTESSELAIAYRGDHRWVQSFEAVRLDPAVEQTTRLRQEGVYLITGGLGSMGLAFAKYLAQTVRAKLVLVTRSGLPPRSEWGQWLSLQQEQALHESPTGKVVANTRLNVELEEEVDYINQWEQRIKTKLAIKEINSYQDLDKIINKLCSSYVYFYLKSQGIDTKQSEAYSKKELIEILRILPKFEKFYEFMLQILIEDEIIKLVDKETIYFLKDEDDIESPELIKREISRRYPAVMGRLKLLEHCVNHYAQALSGDIEAISVLYRNGKSDVINNNSENTLNDSNIQIYLQLTKKIVNRIIEQSSNKKLRVLEIGGGNGTLTQLLLPILKSCNIEYYFTDIGKTFVIKAEKEALKLDYNFMKFGIFDITKEPNEQGYDDYSFDIILGLNVVHATVDVEKSLGNLKKLLVPNGIICLIESVKSQRYIDMVWGLADGWWHFDDKFRVNSPLLSLEKWEKVFQEHNFKSIKTYPVDTKTRAETDSGLIIAQQLTEVSVDVYDKNLKPERDKKKQVINRIRKVQELEEIGSEILVTSADVSSLDQMRSVINQVHQEFGEINGVIHTAGILGTGIIMQKTPAIADSVLAPKVQGTMILDTLLKDVKLDFSIFCSSASSMLPIIGQVDYCAANAFLDTFAHYASKQGKPTISINWGYWQESGMSGDAPVSLLSKFSINSDKGEVKNDSQSETLSNVGVDIFSRILFRCTEPQIIVSPEDFQLRRKKMSTFTQSRILKEAENTHSKQQKLFYLRPDLKNTYVAPSNELEQKVAQVWQEVLGIQEIGIYDNFFDLGGESLLATQLLSRLREAFQVELSFKVFFESPTVTDIAKALVQSQSNGVDNSIHPVEKIERLNISNVLVNTNQISDEEVDSMLNILLNEDEVVE